MIKSFKIVRKIYDEETVPKLTPSSVEYTRGHQHKLDRYDIRKYYFTERNVNIWNSLPDAVVNSSTINQFKNRLDLCATILVNKDVYIDIGQKRNDV